MVILMLLQNVLGGGVRVTSGGLIGTSGVNSADLDLSYQISKESAVNVNHVDRFGFG